MKISELEDKWYGFTEDKVFGWVMENTEFCQFVLQTILPEIDIAKIKFVESQKELNDTDRDSKDVRLDILVTDVNDILYDIEMQTIDEHNLGKRMRYYMAKMDAHYSLDKGDTYNNIRTAFSIFLCDFDFPGKNRLKYVFHEYEDEDRSIMLPTNAHKIIINSKGKLEGHSKNLQDLVKVMRGEKVVGGNKMIKFAQNEIIRINKDPKRKRIIMDYEMKMHEREEYGERKAAVKYLKQYVKDLRDFDVSEDAILERALESYSSDLSPEEIRAIVKAK